MYAKPLMETEQLAMKKQKMFRQSRMRFLARAILAGGFIGIGVIVAFKTGNYFYLEHSPVAYPIAALTFSAAILLIAFGGGDLFTSNTYYYSFAALRKRMSWRDAFTMCGYSYAGNFIGACAFAFLIFGTGLLDDASANSFLLSVAEKKMNAPAGELFFRGILCNWLVCMAFFIPMALKGDGPKIFIMIFFVFCFFVSGYEHSIANMGTFAIALGLDHPETISIGAALHNLIPVTIGNIVGGAVMVSCVYLYMNKPLLMEETDQE